MGALKISKLIPPIILWISVTSVITYSTLPQVNTYFDWFITAIIVATLIVIPNYSLKKQNFYLVKLLLSWYIFSIFRGFLIAETYWDWKGLIGNSFALLLPVVALTGSNIYITRSIFKYYLKYTLPLLIILIFFISNGAIGFFLAPLTLLILFLPILRIEWRFIILCLSLYVITNDLAARSNVIKFLLPLLILFFYYFKAFKLTMVMEATRNVLFLTPILLFILAVNGNFNVFKMDDYIKTDLNITTKKLEGGVKTENLKSDTRTILYVEVLQTASKYNTWWIGRSPARGNESLLFGKDIKKITGRAERLGNEVAILNIFTWSGLIGVILYFLIFYQASYLALNKSNNIFSKMLAIYIAFRWMYAWVEDINYFTSTTFTLWLMIGLCYSSGLRKMSNLEIKLWVRGISYEKRENQIVVLNKPKYEN